MSTSKLQRQTSLLLNTHLGQYTIRENSRPEWLDGLELDFYIEELRVGIEVQGQQHYKYVPMFHQDYAGFLAQQERDQRKADLCQHIGIELHYVEDGREILPLVERLVEIELPTVVHPRCEQYVEALLSAGPEMPPLAKRYVKKIRRYQQKAKATGNQKARENLKRGRNNYVSKLVHLVGREWAHRLINT